ncbi:hypothetical protein N7478_000655 [Penicillium angulare]|uniref:uncharacterized protein n=1 Tax=Penicillium angulare TaxID=116970 RepID=UPI0025408675|nr:uncharacterized protein N7478_000655 [Penicillium angulare]KAJ5291404.1 hypothetical protein N7478_000655 [Penicillium angulare]
MDLEHKLGVVSTDCGECCREHCDEADRSLGNISMDFIVKGSRVITISAINVGPAIGLGTGVDEPWNLIIIVP